MRILISGIRCLGNTYSHRTDTHTGYAPGIRMRDTHGIRIRDTGYSTGHRHALCSATTNNTSYSNKAEAKKAAEKKVAEAKPKAAKPKAPKPKAAKPKAAKPKAAAAKAPATKAPAAKRKATDEMPESSPAKRTRGATKATA